MTDTATIKEALITCAAEAFFPAPATDQDRAHIVALLNECAYRSEFVAGGMDSVVVVSPDAPSLAIDVIERFWAFASLIRASVDDWYSGFDAATIAYFPGWELQRLIMEPKPTVNIPARWKLAGGTRRGKRIALKADPIWTRVGEFGLPFPPFDLECQWEVSDVDRKECLHLGIMRKDDAERLLPRGIELKSSDFLEKLKDAIRLRNWGPAWR